MAIVVLVLVGSVVALGAVGGIWIAMSTRARVASELQLNETAARAAQQMREETERRLAQEKIALRTSPSQFLTVSNEQVEDKGILNSYRELVAVSVLNRSTLPVQTIRGEADWFDAQGQKLGSTKFELTGSIPPGTTAPFSKANGTLNGTTLQGDAVSHIVRVTSLDVP